MRAEWLNLGIFAPNKLCGWQKVNRSQTPHYAYTCPLAVIVTRLKL